MKISVRLLLVLLSSLSGLLVAEGVVRALGWAPQVMRIRPGMKDSAFELSDNPVLGYVLKADYRNASPNNIENVARTNSDGFRDIEREQATDRPRVLLLGDSVVMGLGLDSLEDCISRQMEGSFEGRVEVLNLGIAGYCTRGQVELLEEKGLNYGPDLVVMVFVDNDYEDANSQTSYYNYERPAWAKAAFLRSDAFRAAALRHDWFHFRAEIDKDYTMRQHQNALGADNVRAGVQRLAELSKERGFEVLVAVWPSFTAEGILDRPVPHAADEETGKLR
ncbi:MAG: SGNH/GDSL hydrolase family protein, partial [Planctomycetota bacterium]